MKNESQYGLLLLQRYLYEHTDDQHPASVADILAFWQECGIQAGRKSVYSAIEVLQSSGMDIVCVKSTQNRYFVGERLFELPELKLLVDAVESSRFITAKKSERLIEKLGKLTSESHARQLNRHIYMEGTAKPENECIYYSVDEIHTPFRKNGRSPFSITNTHRKKKRYIKQLGYKIQFIFDESDNISNPSSKQTLSVLSCFRRCKYKLLTTGTSTRNNISEFAPQLELLYNNSINMISWCRTLYSYDKRSADMEHKENPYYAMPIPAYKKGYRLFANSHLPEKITVFGVGQRNQDIYNADELDRLLGKTVITRTFEEVTGKDIRRIHQMPIPFLPEEREVYNIVLKEFYRIQREYYSSTGNSRKDALMRLIQQITLLLRISAAPDCMKEYEGETPLKEMAVVEALARWPEEVVAIGVRHTTVLDRYAAAIREYLPDRPLFVVTGSTVTFAKRRALRDVLRDSQNGILLCTQQSLPSSVNFEFVNKIIIPEMHYNNAGMSQFYMRFVRYTSTEKKDLYFPIYIGSLESNLMQMVLAKEKLTMFMKGQDADMDEIYAKFGVDYDLLSTLMTRETDDEGHLRIHWGEQKIA